MKKMIVLLLAVLSMTFSGCAEKISIPIESKANAYMSVIENLYEYSGSKDDETYVAFDFSKLDSDTKDTVILLARAFCKEHDQTFLEGTIDELMERGYVTPYVFENGSTMAGSFPEGFLITLEPVSATESEVVCEGTRWKGNLGAVGYTYTATFADGAWQIVTSNFRVS
jgi:hypothetical protein